MVKRDHPDPVKVGERLTYTITVTNRGPGRATGVVLVDNLPSGVDIVSVTTSQGDCSTTNPLTCDLGELASGASVTVHIVVIPRVPGEICDTVTVDAKESDPNSENNVARECTTVLDLEADLQVFKQDDADPVKVGEEVTYTIGIWNRGPDRARDVILTDTLPAGMALISATASQGSCTGANPIVCTLGDLPPGAVATVTLLVRAESPGNLCDRASVRTGGMDPNLSNNDVTECTTVESQAVNLVVRKTDDPDPVELGQNLTYTVTVMNQGPATATEVVLSDLLPPEVSAISATASAGNCSLGPPITCFLPDLDPGASAVIRIVVSTQAVGEACNEATAVASQVEQTPEDNRVTECTTIFQVPPGEIQGEKFHDLDADGERDPFVPIFGSPEEKGLSGWTLYVDSDGDGNLDSGEPRALTNERGDYSLAGLRPGVHIVREVLQSGWMQTAPGRSSSAWFVSIGGTFDLGPGSPVFSGDPDQSPKHLELSFPFPFAGREYRDLYVSRDGFLWLGNPRGPEGEPTPEKLIQGAPRLAPFWTDLEQGEGEVLFSDQGDRAVITWVQSEAADGLSFTYSFQSQLNADGEIVFSYLDAPSTSETGGPVIVGLSPGSDDTPPEETDLSDAVPFRSLGLTVYELLESSQEELWDLDRLSLRFTPAVRGGFHRVTVGPGELVTDVDFGNLNVALVVNSTSDGEDAELDGACDTGAVAANGEPECTLRAAIQESNGNPREETIQFDIPGPGPYSIKVQSPLPPILDPVLMDGSSQPGFSTQPVVELNGEEAGLSDGLVIRSGRTQINSLSINGFQGHGVRIEESGGNTLLGNFIGTDPMGLEARGNGGYGIAILGSPNHLVGGTAPQARNLVSANATGQVLVRGEDASGNRVGGRHTGAGNLISGNTWGVSVQGSASSGNLIQGNRVGTDGTGGSSLPNTQGGVRITSTEEGMGGQHNLVGGSDSGAGNLISGNGGPGVALTESDRNRVEGNGIGVDESRNRALPNSGEGVLISGGSLNVVGGTEPSARNIVSGNGGWGIRILGDPARENRIEGNWIGTDAATEENLGNEQGGVVIGLAEVEGAPSLNLVGGEEALASARPETGVFRLQPVES